MHWCRFSTMAVIALTAGGIALGTPDAAGVADALAHTST